MISGFLTLLVRSFVQYVDSYLCIFYSNTIGYWKLVVACVTLLYSVGTITYMHIVKCNKRIGIKDQVAQGPRHFTTRYGPGSRPGSVRWRFFIPSYPDWLCGVLNLACGPGFDPRSGQVSWVKFFLTCKTNVRKL